MNTKTTTISVALTLAGALLLGACSSDVEAPAPAPSATATATAEPTKPAPTDEPIIEAPEVLPSMGEVVTAEDIDKVRESGASVYVSPNGDGSGIVIDPAAALPEVIVQDVVAAGGGAEAPKDITEVGQRNVKIMPIVNELKAAGASAFYLVYSGSYGSDGALKDWGYVVSSINVDGAQAFNASLPALTYTKSKAEAIARVQPLMDANPGVQLIDTVG